MTRKSSKFSMFYRDVLLPRYVFIPFLISRLILEILNVFTFCRFRRSSGSSPLLCLEAGIKGWELIEYKEVLASAEEYVGKENVRKIVIDRSLPYVEQVRQAVCEHRPTHYVYDSRTGSEKWMRGLVDSLRIAILFQLYGVVPICVLTDLPVRAWRAQTAVVSARRGVVVSLMSPRDVMPIFPHRRILGPQLMAFSSGTLSKLMELDAQLQNKFVEKSLVFTGSLYEPRTSLLECVQRGLAHHDINLQIKGRALGSRRFSDDDYWRSLGSATMVITTANLCEQSGVDWPWVSHLIYRYLEVPAVGSVLVAQEVPGLRRYLLPDVHYICYATPEEAVEKIAYYWNHPEALERIATAGREKIRSLVRSSMYWVCVDTALQSDSLIG